MLALLSLLQTRRDWGGASLAERLGVTPRTVRRDVDRLRLLGYTITAVRGPDGGYRLAAGTELPPLLFDDDQAVAIAVALQTAASTGVDLGDAAEQALAAVRQLMPSRLRHRVDGVQFDSPIAPEQVDPAALQAVSSSIRRERVLRFDYGVESEGYGLPRKVEPHGLVSRAGRWYLVAWDLEKTDWRLFRLDRLTPKSPEGAPFAPREIPGGNALAFVDSMMKGSVGVDRWPVYGDFLLEAPTFRVAPWLGDGEMEAVSPSVTRVRVGSWSPAGLLAWVMRFDAPFTALGPEELIRSLPTIANRLREAVPGGN